MAPSKPAAADGPSLTLDNEALARHYDRVSAERQFVAGKQLAHALAIKAGERVLDVGCGTGLLAEHIAGLTGPSGSVLGIDPLPARIAIAVSRARDGLAFRVGDAYALGDLQSGSFDVVLLNAVFHWLPEKKAPLREFARLLRRGGRLGISTRLNDHNSPIREAFVRVLAKPPFSEFPMRQRPMVHRVSEQEMGELLREAGFAVERLEVRRAVRKFGSADEMIRFSEASSFGNLLGNFPAEARDAARDILTRELDEVLREGPLEDERFGLVAIGVRA